MHTAVKTQNSRINSVFALIALIELVRLVLWVENGVMRQKKLLFIEIELGKKIKKISKEFPQVGFEPSTSRLVA